MPTSDRQLEDNPAFSGGNQAVSAGVQSDELTKMPTTSSNNPKIDQTVKPNRYSSNIKARQQRIHALKVGVGVLIALQLVLVEPLDTFFQQTGVWAVITVVIVILPTPGETTKKMMNRVIGTVSAAVLAIGLGMAGHELSQIAYPAGHVLVALVDFVAAVLGTHMADQGGTWSYAYLLGTVTFTFLSSSILVEDDIWVGVFRALMIGIGGIVGLIVSWLPPTVSATALAKAYLADALLDTSVAVEVLMDEFLNGRELTPVYLISGSKNNDDPFHQVSRAIQLSRIPLEAALEASSFEGTHKSDVDLMRISGLAVRMTLRSLLAADMLLRQGYQPLDPSMPEEAELGMALKRVVSSIHGTMLCHEMIDHNLLTLSGGENGKVNGGCEELPLPQALAELESCLGRYIITRGSGACGEGQTMKRVACHIGFSRNIYDAGAHFLQVLPHLIASDLGSTAHSSCQDSL